MNTDNNTVATKPWWQSRSIWGNIIAMVCMLLVLTGALEASEAENFKNEAMALFMEGSAIASQVIAMLATVYAMYGRIVAKAKIE